jgi:Domain of unknown function (DUF5666)
MKKNLWVILIIVPLCLSIVGAGFAKPKTDVVKGQVTALGDGTLTLDSRKDGTVVVTLPADFDSSTIKVGDMVMVKGVRQADGSLVAGTVRVLGADDDSNGQEDGKPEATGKANSAFCSPGKKDKDHPLAYKLSEEYGVSTDWVMGYFCSGHGMGAIMLALKTSQLTGADPDSLLVQRAAGEGWGQIWQKLGLIGSKKDIKAPPGQLKKPAGSGPDD